MSGNRKLTEESLRIIETNPQEAIMLVKKYALAYSSKEHYEHLGASCVVSATNTVNTLINSANHLNGSFLAPDEIHIDRLVDWFMKNKEYEIEQEILACYLGHYIKKKIYEFYRSISKDELASSLTILENPMARKGYNQHFVIKPTLRQ